MARFPPVDMYGRETIGTLVDQAGSHGQWYLALLYVLRRLW